MKMTVRDLITQSLKDLGVVAPGESVHAHDAHDSLESLNALVDDWSSDGCMIFNETIETFPLRLGVSQYTIGPEGDFDTERPVELVGAGFKQYQDQVERPLDLYNLQQWKSVYLKDLRTSIPYILYYNESYPLGEINLWPVPDESSEVILYSLKPLQNMDSLDYEISLPPSYKRALRKNLAVEVADMFGVTPSNHLQVAAMDSKANVMRSNEKPAYLSTNVPADSRKHYWDWRTGE